MIKNVSAKKIVYGMILAAMFLKRSEKDRNLEN